MTRPFDPEDNPAVEIVTEYETGSATRATAFRRYGPDGVWTHVREEWVDGSDGWRLVGSESVRLQGDTVDLR